MIVVAGVDDSPQGEIAARRALREAERWGAALHAVHVVHVPGTLLAALDQVPAGVEDLERAQEEAVWDRIGPILAEAPVPVERVSLRGYPPDALVQYAERVGAELIVVGSRGRGDLAALVLGSTSHRILHLAHCDVLVAKGSP